MYRSIAFATLVLSLCNFAFARPTNVGYSGAPGSLGRCASTCHGVNGGTVAITGFPAEYVPDSTYLLTIAALSGPTIKNFNGSVRVGSGSATAGVISAGMNTTTYSVAQEPNGVKLAVNDRPNGTFSWRAPTSGTGVVRLYVAAHQGDRNSGPNTDIVLLANELITQSPPDAPQNPTPPVAATGIPVSTSLSWSPVPDAEYYDIYFGAQNPPALMEANHQSESFALHDLLPATQYFWQVRAVNEGGTTPGPVWSFTTETASAIGDVPLTSEFSLGAAYPNPFNGIVRVSLNIQTEAIATVAVYDRTGRLVATLLDQSRIGDNTELEWNAAGNAAGVYFLRCNCSGVSQTQKLVYLP